MNRKSINLTQKQIENRALIVTTVVNAIITGAGIWMYFLTDLQMMFLDGFFSLIGSVVGACSSAYIQGK